LVELVKLVELGYSYDVYTSYKLNYFNKFNALHQPPGRIAMVNGFGLSGV